MTTELTNTMPAYLQQAGDELQKQKEMVKNPLAIFPGLLMNKDQKGFAITVGEEVVNRFDGELFITVLGVGNFYMSRALFPPEGYSDNDSKMPVCACKLTNPNNPRCTGKWMDANFKSPSGSELVECDKCPWSKFGSEPIWDESKEGRGPACKERRVIFVVLMQRTGDSTFAIADEKSIMLRLPATSIKAADEMNISSITAGIPLSAAVFKISNEIKKNGKMTWTVLNTRLAGYVGKEEDYKKLLEEGQKVALVVQQTGEDTTTYESTSHSADAEVPF